MKMAVPWVLANATRDEEVELRATAPRLLSVVNDMSGRSSFAP
jgi:hypothetical protein